MEFWEAEDSSINDSFISCNTSSWFYGFESMLCLYRKPCCESSSTISHRPLKSFESTYWLYYHQVANIETSRCDLPCTNKYTICLSISVAEVSVSEESLFRTKRPSLGVKMRPRIQGMIWDLTGSTRLSHRRSLELYVCRRNIRSQVAVEWSLCSGCDKTGIPRDDDVAGVRLVRSLSAGLSLENHLCPPTSLKS
jgi:hypothetical protein